MIKASHRVYLSHTLRRRTNGSKMANAAEKVTVDTNFSGVKKREYGSARKLGIVRGKP